jgi:hypothetical protein
MKFCAAKVGGKDTRERERPSILLAEKPGTGKETAFVELCSEGYTRQKTEETNEWESHRDRRELKREGKRKRRMEGGPVRWAL